MCYEEKWFAFLCLTWHLALNFHLVFFRGYFYRYQEFRWEWKSGSLFYHSCRFYVSKWAPSLCIPHNHTTTYDVTMWRNYCVAGLIVTNHDTTLSHHFATKMDNICLTRYDTSCDVIDDIVHPSASDYVLWRHPYLQRAAWHTQKSYLPNTHFLDDNKKGLPSSVQLCTCSFCVTLKFTLSMKNNYVAQNKI